MKVNLNEGLTSDEVRRRVSEGLINKSVGNQSKTVGQIIAGNLFTYFNLVFAIFAGLLIMVGSYINMTFLPVVVINTLIGIVQEIRAKKVLDRLNLITAPKTKVIRDGKCEEILSESLVKDDLCIFSAGNQICADGEIVEGSVRVNEALVTGEEEEILKYPGDKLLSGSFVVSGECKAILQGVGYESYAAKIMLEAKTSRRKQQSEMMRSLDKLVKIIGIIIVPIGIIMYCESRFVLGNTIKDSVVSMIASLVGMIPEGLYLLASMALAVSVMRLGKKRVLMHEMACVETLARVNILCVDKTGTITDNEMAVENVIYIGNDDEKAASEELLRGIVYNLKNDNNTIKAIKEYCKALEKDGGDSYTAASRVCPFSSEVKYSAVVMDGGCYVLGAPEYLMKENYKQYESIIKEEKIQSGRILVLGQYFANEEEMEALGKEPLVRAVKLMAVIALSNNVRREAGETFAYFARQGVNVKVISGDNPETVLNVARKAGIEGADEAVDMSHMDSDEKISEAAVKYNIFGRTNPEQKKKIVKALQARGNVVAMTGDGVNDVLALKTADCSVALGSGSDAAANAAQVVLMDSDFSSMPSVVLEGRRVVNNIQRSASLFLVKNIFSILLTIYTLIAVNRYPLYPTQLSLLGIFTVGMPGFLLAMQPNRDIIRGKFIRNVIIKALPAALTDFIIVIVLSVLGEYYGTDHNQLATMTALVIIAVGLLMLIRICKPMNLTKRCICVMMLAGIVLSVIFLPNVFAIYPLSLRQIVITALCVAAAIPLFIMICYIVERIDKKNMNKGENNNVRTD